MARIVDNIVALRILKMLVTPFEETKAFKLGIIDAKGKNLRKSNTLQTAEELDSYTHLHRLVFNVKKLINRLPGGENRLKSLIAALWLVKEYYESGNRSTSLMQEKFDNIMKMLDNRVSLIEEEIIVKKFLSEDSIGGAPTNNTAGASVNEPKIGKKDIKKYHASQGGTIAGMVRRPKPVVKGT
jgi:hypothetical protein